ncbi:MAG: hypothetical protein OEM52_10390 [bacterium]|nr:hypothetical protein [bacterium]
MEIKHELVNENAVFTGSAVEVVHQMRSQLYFEKALPFREYLKQLIETIESIGGPELHKTVFSDDESLTDEQLAERFIQGIVSNGIFKEA